MDARRPAGSEWLQQESEFRLGPLVVRGQGRLERRSASVTGRFGGLTVSGALGLLIDTKGATEQRDLSMRPTP
jgi:hypothetical protein